MHFNNMYNLERFESNSIFGISYKLDNYVSDSDSETDWYVTGEAHKNFKAQQTFRNCKFNENMFTGLFFVFTGK